MKVSGAVTINNTTFHNQVVDEGVVYLLNSFIAQQPYPLTNAFLLPDGFFSLKTDLRGLTWDKDIKDSVVPGLVCSTGITSSGENLGMTVALMDTKETTLEVYFTITADAAVVGTSTPTRAVSGAAIIIEGNANESCFAYPTPSGNEGWPRYAATGKEKLFAIVRFPEVVQRDGVDDTRVHWLIDFDNTVASDTFSLK